MSLPALDTPVMLKIPDRETISARVDEVGHGWLDLDLRHAPRTPPGHLERHSVFLEWVDPAGLVRIMGHVKLSPTSPRVGPPILRFTHREVIQLLRRRDFAGGLVHARVTLVRSEEEGGGVAHATKTVAVGSKEFAVHDLPGATEGDLYEFTIWPGGNEPPVTGRGQVSRVAAKGHVVIDFTMVAEFERERLGRLLIGRDER
jgi:hypothetical protein